MSDNMQSVYFDSILSDLKVADSKQLYSRLSNHTAQLIGIPEKFLLGLMMEQERRQGSGIGKGVAIPHIRLARLTKPMVVFAKLARPVVDIEAVDEDPVDLVCLVMTPAYEGPTHLQRLSRITRFMSNTEFCDSLRKAVDADEIRMVLKEANNRKLAA